MPWPTINALVVELFGRDYARLRIGVKFQLLAVLDAFAFPSTVFGFKLGNLRIARLENLLDYLLGSSRYLPSAGKSPARMKAGRGSLC